jgi:hypothetical protein
MRRQYIEEVNLSLFDFKLLITKLKPLFAEEQEFYKQVSTILVKLMQDDMLNDSERCVVTVYKEPGNFTDVDYLAKTQKCCVNMPQEGPQSLGMSFNYLNADN